MLDAIQRCFEENRVLYSRHARHEMRTEEFGVVSEEDVAEAVAAGEMIEDYPDDEPYPSMLIFGRTDLGRPLHVVAAYAAGEDTCTMITVYHPDPSRWIEYRRRRT